MSKKIISADSEELELSPYLTTLEDLIRWVDGVKKDFPEKSVIHGYVSGYDSDNFTIRLSTHREETDFEYENRLNKEKWEKRRAEDDEKEMYRRLKAKFGDDK